MRTSPVLVTGAAGFIGFHLARRLLEQGRRVVGLDNLNDYYDVSLKEARIGELSGFGGFSFVRGDLADRPAVETVFDEYDPGCVVNLAAQAGVRYSLENPMAYVDSNLVGFAHLLEACRGGNVEHLVFASSSSVYGANRRLPFSVHDNVDHPVSLYAATKKANELMAHTYADLYGLPVTGLRFFTVYGPWGRPDMAYFLFTKAIIEGRPIRVFNEGRMRRDFTYIDDVIEAVVRVLDRPPEGDPAWDGAAPDPAIGRGPYRIYNIGNHQPVELMEFIGILEGHIGKSAEILFEPMQPGDVEATYADVNDLKRDVGFSPETPLSQGLERFVAWYRGYYGETAD